MPNPNKYIFLDFNGTVLNDIDLCLELLNDLLKQTGKEGNVSLEEYLDIFGFPVIDYYKRAGLEFDKISFAEMADFFIKEYTERNTKECTIFPDFKQFIDRAHQRGFKIVLCSASKKILLIDQLIAFGIYDCFDDVIGLDNHHAASKLDIARNYVGRNNINPDNTYFIGDCDHDAEVGLACGSKTILVARGHQSRKVLEKCGMLVVDSLLEALDSIK